jgi:hypothetical protein
MAPEGLIRLGGDLGLRLGPGVLAVGETDGPDSPSAVSRMTRNSAGEGLTLPKTEGNFPFLLRGGAAR